MKSLLMRYKWIAASVLAVLIIVVGGLVGLKLTIWSEPVKGDYVYLKKQLKQNQKLLVKTAKARFEYYRQARGSFFTQDKESLAELKQKKQQARQLFDKYLSQVEGLSDVKAIDDPEVRRMYQKYAEQQRHYIDQFRNQVRVTELINQKLRACDDVTRASEEITVDVAKKPNQYYRQFAKIHSQNAEDCRRVLKDFKQLDSQVFQDYAETYLAYLDERQSIIESYEPRSKQEQSSDLGSVIAGLRGVSISLKLLGTGEQLDKAEPAYSQRKTEIAKSIFTGKMFQEGRVLPDFLDLLERKIKQAEKQG